MNSRDVKPSQPEGFGQDDSGNLWDELNFFNTLPGYVDSQESGNVEHAESQTFASHDEKSTASLVTAAREDLVLLFEDKNDAACGERDISTKSKAEDCDLDDEEIIRRRRAAAAAASRATRAKKKRVIGELRGMNDRLEQEQQKLRRIVADLELEVLAKRAAGEIDLVSENRLLREELKEHKQFLAKCQRVADGCSVSRQEKDIATLKGAKAAIGQVLGLLYTR